VGLEQTLAPAAVLTRARRTTLLVPERETDPARQVLDRLGEPQTVDLLQERDDVAAFSAPEAVPESDLRPDVERR
jgi:hypothetical protein